MRTALITGASAGLGAEFARQLAALGYRLVLVARRLDKLEASAITLKQQYASSAPLCIQADLSDAAAPAMIAQSLEEQGIKVDYLVNNAGAAGPDLLQDQPWSVHQAYMNLMMSSVTELCHRFVPGMIERGFGRVINVASVMGRMARGGDCHYGPAKAYLISLSENMDLTVRNAGVRVSALCPGFTHTDFHEVAGMDDIKRTTPGFIWYSAEVVVAEALDSIEAGKSVAVSGRFYRWIDPLLQIGPLRRWITNRTAVPYDSGG